ncbi:SDR family oxidoreductase [Terrimonas sp. NA20]|uniref:SDR family oxidoreductase n=1 Tax=Terrimonas ginsenosidimutans TaxID=2908004 RepID=A0ABS9KM04_9BACT|nr:SDR family oxidoreductase [Terrimonas ginsenosidimutans]MCG2613355.1 SDR family oxidoreductase [Terrimonas ginsenosidimutans]
MKHDFDFSNKTVVITGASSGVGKAIALELARYGARLVLAARRKEALEELALECEQLGTEALAVPTDMNAITEIRALAAKAVEFGGSIDAWINNAGVLAAGPVEDVPAEVNEQVIKTNLTGYIHAAHTIIPYFKNQEHGILINNISVGGWFPTPYSAAYTASKFGLCGFSQALKGELHGWDNIHVCDLYPAFLDTPGMQHSANYTGKELKPVPPVYSPQKVAEAVAELIDCPQPQKTVGLTAKLLRLAFLVFPTISRTATVFVIRRYLKRAKAIEYTSGNVLEPVLYGTSAEGGWQKKTGSSSSSVRKGIVVAAAAGLLIGLLLSRSRQHS